VNDAQPVTGPGGPLAGTRVIEIAGIGPAPFAGMLLADMGADVVRIDRASQPGAGALRGLDVLARGRRSVGLDLKHPDGLATALSLADRADVLIEGFRPGVVERLGLGPSVCHRRNPRLVYGRMTGWGQDGPWAARAGHDIDYIALAGALHPIGPADRPPAVPLNLVGDFGGGGMLLAFGVVCALLERERSGQGQVVDAAMVDGSALLTGMFHGMLAAGHWSVEREANLLDGGAPFYRAYRCADGEFVAVGALEPQFHAELLRILELDAADWPQNDRACWPTQTIALEAVFAGRTREEWAAVFEGSDACVAPVLSLTEARSHPHLAARATFVEHDGLTQPAPAPRFSRTPASLSRPPVLPGQHTDEILAEVGFSADDVARMRAAGAVA
jgi:alpha-methylacyl-CoA racemase